MSLGCPREDGDGLGPASQETCRRDGRMLGGVPRCRSITLADQVFIGCLGSPSPHPAYAQPARSKHLARALYRGTHALSDTAITELAELPAPTAATTIYVCTTCRQPGDPDDMPRRGAALATTTARIADGSDVTVLRVRCLANCKRGCSAAVRRAGGWTYVFGDLDPETAGADLVEGARLFAAAADGVMPWRGRPEPLKRGLIARIPPIDFMEESE
jgi:predicted metal-binding protein